jgi:hypothetical protein
MSTLCRKSFDCLYVAIVLMILLTGCSSYGGLGYLDESAWFLRFILVIVGLLYLLAGYKIHQFVIQITGFIFGGIIGSVLGAGLADNLEGFYAVLGFLICGTLGAAIALFLAGLGIFVVGAIVGAATGGLVHLLVFRSDPDGVVYIIWGIIGGIVFTLLYRFWITGITAILGAIMVGVGTNANPIWWVIFFLIGFAVQYGLAKYISPKETTTPLPGSNLPQTPGKPVTLHDAQRRLAAGEITLDEYYQLRDQLTS